VGHYVRHVKGKNVDSVIRISEALYRAVVKEAAARQRSPDELAEELLARQLLPQHPHVEKVESRSGTRAVVRGTRVGVDVIVGYLQAGYAPEEIASDVLSHLTLAQVYDAISYFYDHPNEIEEMLDAHAVHAWQKRLRERLGKTAYARLTGEAASA
jgi:uncharacterized protein (DUF433 family)